MSERSVVPWTAAVYCSAAVRGSPRASAISPVTVSNTSAFSTGTGETGGPTHAAQPKSPSARQALAGIVQSAGSIARDRFREHARTIAKWGGHCPGFQLDLG